MSKKQKPSKDTSNPSDYSNRDLHSIFRSQIVQQYPYTHNNVHLQFQQADNSQVKVEKKNYQSEDDLLEKYLCGSDIVEGYEDYP